MRMQDLSNSLRKNWGASLVALAAITASCSSDTAVPVITVIGESIELPSTCREPLEEYLADVVAAFDEFDARLELAEEEFLSDPANIDAELVDLELIGVNSGARSTRVLAIFDAEQEVPSGCFANDAPSPESVLTDISFDQETIAVGFYDLGGFTTIEVPRLQPQ